MDQPHDPHAIFDNDLLLDTILDYHIGGAEEKMKVTYFQRCRLVSKAWLRCVSRVLQKSETPMFFFHLPRQQHNEDAFVQFIESVTGNVHLDERVPPHAITASGYDIQPITHKRIFDCLTNCGSGLIQLDLRMAEKPPTFSLRNNLFLPKLVKFSASLYGKYIGAKGLNSKQDDIDFIQSVFDASGQLKSFTLNSYSHEGAVPDCFGNLLFPSSLVNLDLNFLLNDCQLQAILNSSLYNLSTLKVVIGSSPLVGDGLVTSILEKLEKTLQSFHLRYSGSVSQEEGPTTLQLPLMKNLKEIHFSNICPTFKLQGRGSCFQQIVPMLNRVTLIRQTRAMLRKWSESSGFPSVTFLKVSVVSDENRYLEVDLDLASMQALHMTFPNVTELNISQIETTYMTATLFVMKEMRNLRSLGIRILESSDVWDSVFIGIPQESAAALRESPDLWRDLQVGSDVSIRNLTELETLYLRCGVEGDFSCISELTFQYAFLRMPKLTNLTLIGGFWTTREVARNWKREGRSIKTAFHADDEAQGNSEDEGGSDLDEESETEY